MLDLILNERFLTTIVAFRVIEWLKIEFSKLLAWLYTQVNQTITSWALRAFSYNFQLYFIENSHLKSKFEINRVLSYIWTQSEIERIFAFTSVITSRQFDIFFFYSIWDCLHRSQNVWILDSFLSINNHTMAYKRPSDSLVAIPETKRSRNEIAAYTNKDKQLLEVVREHNLYRVVYGAE